ncbi:MAG TPA: radical SAM protein [Anaerolineales bacterium]|nr:radical SAM protein [Anaerolineales bacterium]
MKNPRPGLYHFERQSQGERSRIHLRIDHDQSGRPAHGTLLINANRVLHLNPTASVMAYLALNDTPMPGAIRDLTHLFRVSPTQAKYDYTQFIEDFDQLLRPDGACPVCELDVEITAPFTARPSAPYRMDLALTYRCNDNCAHCYNARPRDYPELRTEEWKAILDRLWEIGIPHIVFTGGEPTLRSDLPELIAHAEKNGQITGLNTNARRLIDVSFVKQLVDTGLDHVQITVESHDPVIHDAMVCAKGAWTQTITGLRNVLDTPLFVMTNTTMLRQNSPFLGKTLDFLASLGVPTIGLNALIYSGHGLTVGTGLTESELRPLLDLARKKTDSNGQRLIWYTPTQYCHFDPMQLELGIKGCTAALYNMCVEPDGGVIPCQSYYQQLGNLLTIPWEAIWNHELAVSLRERRYIPPRCNDCVLLSECGGGCPLALNTLGNGLISLDNLPLSDK